MSHDLVINGVTYNGVKSISIPNANGETVQYHANSVDTSAQFKKVKLPSVETYGAVGYGGGKYVAIASGGLAAYSEDGVNWTQAQTLSTVKLANDIAYGNGMYVAAHIGSMLYSTDGVTWTECTMPMQSSGWTAVCYGSGVFVALSIDWYMAYSTDGINWTQVGSQYSYGGGWCALAYGDGKFVVTLNQRGFPCLYSTDGITWKWDVSVDGEFEGSASCICYGGGKFVVLTGGEGRVAVSENGVNWIARAIPFDDIFTSVTYGNGVYIGVCKGETDDDIYANTTIKKAIYSTDGINWQEIEMPSAQLWVSICYGDNGFVAISERGVAAHSVDGLNWTEVDLPATYIRVGSVCYGGGKFVAVSVLGIMYSKDGISWYHAADVPLTEYWTQVAYGNGIFVVMGARKILYSTNGSWWTAVDNDWWSNMALCFANGKFIVGYKNPSPDLHYSTDGINWETTMGATLYVNAIAYGGGKYVEISYADDEYDEAGYLIGRKATSAKAGYSTDGITWTETTMPSEQRWVSVCYGKGRFVAIADETQYGAYSKDGINWTQIELPVAQKWASVIYGNGLFIAVAANSEVAAYSIDGIEWVAIPIPLTGTYNSYSGASAVYNKSLCYGDGKFISANETNGYCAVCDVTKPLK